MYVYVIEYVSLNLLWHPHFFPEPGGGLLQEFTPVRPKQKVGGTQDLKAVKPLE